MPLWPLEKWGIPMTNKKTGGWKFLDLSAQFVSAAVADHAEVVESEVEMEIHCNGCGDRAFAWGNTRKEARNRIRLLLQKGKWAAVFDRKVNDGEYPYCGKCVKSIFPNLKARLRSQSTR